MALRNILVLGDETLTKISKPVTDFDQRLGQLIDDMAQTMYHADGAGLAAPQVGVLRRVVVVDAGDGLIELVNPRIVAVDGEQTGQEGCLSVPGRYGIVTRPQRVTVAAQDRYGNDKVYTGEGLLARAFCHELEHLDGILYITHVQGELMEV